jgi:hypothetical protein
MDLPPRLIPLLEQFDFARERLANRLSGPSVTAEMAGRSTADRTGPAMA